MTLRVGDTCYLAIMSGRKIEFWEYVLRTIRKRNGLRYGYWWNKLPGQTWGKLSKKHRDYGWLPDAWPGWREKYPTDRGRPFATTKLGALRREIASVRANIDEYGPDYDLDEEGATLGEQLSALLRAQTRLRGGSLRQTRPQQ